MGKFHRVKGCDSQNLEMDGNPEWKRLVPVQKTLPFQIVVIVIDFIAVAFPVYPNC